MDHDAHVHTLLSRAGFVTPANHTDHSSSRDNSNSSSSNAASNSNNNSFVLQFVDKYITKQVEEKVYATIPYFGEYMKVKEGRGVIRGAVKRHFFDIFEFC